MNYIKQINAFFELTIANPLSSNAQCLYFNLLNINNKCNWVEEFTTANSTLMTFTSLNKQTLYRARNELIQRKFIEFKKGINQNQSGKYKIISFVTAHDTAHDTAGDTADDTPNDTPNNTNNKLKETKLKETKETAVKEIINCYEENIGMITSAASEELLSYLDSLDYQLIVKAIKLSAIRNKRSTAYICGILNSWVRKGYKVLADIQQEQKEESKKEETEEEKNARKLKELEEAIANDNW